MPLLLLGLVLLRVALVPHGGTALSGAEAKARAGRQPSGGLEAAPPPSERAGGRTSGFSTRTVTDAPVPDAEEAAVNAASPARGPALVRDRRGGEAAAEAAVELPEITATDFAALSTPQQEMVLRLATGGPDAVGTAADEPTPEICFAPGTAGPVVRAFTAARARREALTLGPGVSTMARQLGSRWTSTATAGTGTSQGDRAVLRWSIVPDGTSIPGDGAGEVTSPSNLRAWLDARYGSEAVWLPLIESVFENWSQLSGVTYIHEPNDDGAAFPSTSGSVGVRGDVRLSGHAIDGNFNVLAYNFFPNTGDMVIDTSDSWFADTSNNSAKFRLVLAHEHGHGLGLRHVCPVDQTKLMEPFASTAITGPRQDDIFSVQRLYGDRFEANNSSATARDFGVLPAGTSSWQNLSVDDNSDSDFYRFNPPGPGWSVTVVARPVGSSYLEGAQNADGSCSAGTTFNSLSVHNLNIQLRNTNGTTVLASASAAAAGAVETLADVALPAGSTGPFFVRVNSGNTTNNAQLYELEITLTPPLPALSVADVTVSESAGDATVTVTADAAPGGAASAVWTAVAGTAESGADFLAASGTVEFAAGQSVATVDVPLLNDALDEPDETFQVTLSAFVGAQAGAQTTATVTVTDDDEPPLVTLTAPASFPEAGGGGVEATAALSAPSGRTVTVDYATVAGQSPAAVPDDDYVSMAGTLTFLPGQTELALPAVNIIDDALAEPDEWLTFALTNAVNVTLSSPALAVRVRDDDAPAALASTGGFSEPDSSGHPVIRWSTVPGRFYRVETSDDLVTWSALAGAETLEATAGALSVSDPAVGPVRRYYRVLDVPAP